MQPTTRLKIKLWSFTVALLALVFIFGVIAAPETAPWQRMTAAILTVMLAGAFLGTIVSGWLGYASFIQTAKKEAHRGESHHHRP